MNLIRLILLQAEEGVAPAGLEKYSKEEHVYNTALAIEAGLIKGGVTEDGKGFPMITATTSLTWAGHDFLDAARNDSTWSKAVGVLKDKGLSVTFDVMKDLLTAMMRSQIGLP
jgi:hypothetical protein